MRLLSAAIRSYAAAIRSYAAAITDNSRTLTTFIRRSKLLPSALANGGGLLDSPWSATQLRRARFSGGDVRPGNVIERRGKIYEVIKADHTTQGRGGAIIQVELRDVDSGSKVNERLRTDEKVEKIYVEEKSLTYLYTDEETGNIVLMEPATYNQLEVPAHLFGDSCVYLQEDMEITVQLYDEKPLSASLPHRVTCTVSEADEARQGSSKSSPSKRVLLDNGITLQAPAHIAAGDKIVVNTTNNSYVSRA